MKALRWNDTQTDDDDYYVTFVNGDRKLSEFS